MACMMTASRRASATRAFFRSRRAAGPTPRLCANGRTGCSRSWKVHNVRVSPPMASRCGNAKECRSNPSVINSGNATRLIGQQRLDDHPFPIRQFVAPPCHQASIAMESLNHVSRKTSSQLGNLRFNVRIGRLSTRHRYQGRHLELPTVKTEGMLRARQS